MLKTDAVKNKNMFENMSKFWYWSKYDRIGDCFDLNLNLALIFSFFCCLEALNLGENMVKLLPKYIYLVDKQPKYCRKVVAL